MALILRCRNGGRASSEASPSSWRLGATLPRARRACARVRSVISDVTGRALYTGAWGEMRAPHIKVHYVWKGVCRVQKSYTRSASRYVYRL